MNIFQHMIETVRRNEELTQPAHHTPEIVRYQHDHNTSEGGEYLDDAIRMADQLPDNQD